MNIRNFSRLSALLFCAAAFTAGAEDIELFMSDAAVSTTPPNVLFVLDNSANWNATLFKVSGFSVTKKDIIHEALYKAVMDPMNTSKLSVGFSEFASHSGGKITAAVKLTDTTYQHTLGRKIYNAVPWTAGASLALNTYVLPNYSSDTTKFPNNWNSHYYQVTTAGVTGASEPAWPTNGTTVTDGTAKLKDMGLVYGATAIQAIPSYNNAPYALALHETYLYYRGDTPLYGTADTDYDHTAVSGGKYVSPNAAQHCEKNFLVIIGSGSPDSGENTDAFARLWQLYKDNGVTSQPVMLNITPNNYASSWGDEYAGFFNTLGDANKVEAGKQAIAVYVIDVYDTTKAVNTLTKPEQAARAYLKSIGEQGKGGYFAAGSADELSAALQKIEDEMKAVNSVFASTTLPVSINVRGTNLNQVYMGVFRPDKNKKPQWYGNLKMYKLGYDTSTQAVFLADALGNRADSAVTGFITSTAASFWTHPTDPTVYTVSNTAETQWWWWWPHGDATLTADQRKSDKPDGDLVEKGGSGQWLREHPSVRRLYTCHTCTKDSPLESFSPGTVTASDLGLAAGSDPAPIVNFVIGQNPVQNTTNGMEQVRAMVHGDVLHSRPATINYGPDGDDVVTYYGANDGVFHAVKGGETAASWDHVVGEELWGFVPPESFTNLTKLYENADIDGSHPKPYFVDGTIMTLRWDGENYVYLTMRRGGRAIYALNVNDDLKQAPTIAWHKNSSNFPELGQTWSDPAIYLASIKTTASTIEKRPVIVMGGGYDPAEDLDETTGASNNMGRGVYVLDALTGEKIQFLGNTSQESGIAVTVADSIPGGVKSAGSIDRITGLQTLTTAYAADTGGNVWKLDFTNPDPFYWTMTKVAALGGIGAANRKFLYQPDVVNRSVGYTALLVGTGDREHPKDTSVVNYFFMLKDYYDATKNHWPLLIGDVPDVTTASTYTDTDPGWKVQLTGTGEKDVGNAITMNGVVFFNTNVPFSSTDPSTCAPSLGEARAYAISLNDGSPATGTGSRYVVAPGGGFLPSPVPFTVDINGVTVSGIISGTQVKKPPQPNYGHTTHQFWYKRGVDKQ